MPIETLAALGRVTVNFTLLETATNAVAKAVGGVVPKGWQDDIALGGKLQALKKLPHQVTDTDLRLELEEWISATDGLRDERNRTAKTLMAYGADDQVAAIVTLGKDELARGKPGVVDPAAVNDLARRLRDVAIDGIKLSTKPNAVRLR